MTRDKSRCLITFERKMMIISEARFTFTSASKQEKIASVLKHPFLTTPIIRNSINYRARLFTKSQFEGFVSFRIFRSTLYKNIAHK